MTDYKLVPVEGLRYTFDGALAECPCCGSLDVGGAHDTVHCQSCGLTVTKPRPLQNAIDAWNTRTSRAHSAAPAVQGEPVARQPADELRFEYRHPKTGEAYTISLSREEVAELMDQELFEKLTACLCECEPIGETNVVDCRCDEHADQFELVAAPQPAEQKPFEWPLLDAPALIGGVVVGKGCSSGHVVMIAQRKYQYEAEHSPEEHARRKKAFQDALAQIRDGVGQQPDEAWSDDADSDSAAVAEAIRAREEAIAQVSGLQLQVAGLVEALEHVRYWIDRRVSAQGIVVADALSKIDTALSAHRKGGE